MKSFCRLERYRGTFWVGEQVSAGKQHSTATTIIKARGTRRMAWSPKCFHSIAQCKFSLKNRHLQSRQQISFLLLNQDIAPGGFLNLPRLADSAAVGEKQQSHTAARKQKGLVNLIPSGTIHQDVRLVFYNEISCRTQSISVRRESKDIVQYGPGLFGD